MALLPSSGVNCKKAGPKVQTKSAMRSGIGQPQLDVSSGRNFPEEGWLKTKGNWRQEDHLNYNVCVEPSTKKSVSPFKLGRDHRCQVGDHGFFSL